MLLMDASQSALDSLRTVEFRETLKGYHRDDVDEYLEKAAVEAEGLQEQLRQSGDRLRQAAERIAQLETALEHKPEPEVVPVPAAPDDTLQRTLLLAQKFVDETKADSEARAAEVLAEADAKARQMTEEAQTQATQIAAESEQRLRDEISRLEVSRSKLARDVETMTRHLENERARLRGALSEILRWVDENVQPTTAEAQARTGVSPESGGDAEPSGAASEATPASGSAAAAVQGGPRPTVVDHPGATTPNSSDSEPTAEVTQIRPSGSMAASSMDANTSLPR
jgi:DivIVA domain-containing protein